MKLRIGELHKDGFYHIFNRGVEKKEIFHSEDDYRKFYELIQKSNFCKDTHSKLVDIYAFSLLPNHYHFVLKQVSQKGVERFVRNLCNVYARYFNKKNGLEGYLFVNVFKYIQIHNDPKLMEMISYVNKNHLKHSLIPPLTICSGDKELRSGHTVINKRFILKLFKTLDRYEQKSQGIIEYRKRISHSIENLE